MKTNFKTLAAAMIAMAIGTASCSKDSSIGNEAIDNGKPSSVSIVLTEGSRAVAAPAQKVAVTFNDGYVIFTNNVGVVNKVTEIVSGSYPGTPTVAEQNAKAAGTKVWLDDMKSSGGGEIKNVPAAATMVYIVGNLPSGTPAPKVTDNIATIKDRAISVTSQSNDDGSVADVTLYGDGANLDPHPTDTNAKKATVTVKPIASRIEIGQISYNTSNDFVTGFQIDGIFVNHYYPQMTLSGKANVALINNNLATTNAAADLVYMYNSSAYKDTDEDKLYDYSASGIGKEITSTSWKADDSAGNVWAYNVLAPTAFDGSNVAALATPHVVIRLSNLTNTGDPQVYTGTQYLTVKTFRSVKTDEILSRFEPGVIYYITKLVFNESNLTEIPEQDAVTAYVEAVLMTWEREEVEVEL